MASTTITSKLFQKLGSRLTQAAEKAKSQQVKVGFQRLPGGIPNGIAQLDTCGFFEYKADTNQKKADGSSAAGETYFRCAGVVVSPEKNLSNVPVRGLQTSKMIPLCPTKQGTGTVQDLDFHFNEVFDLLASLAATDKQGQQEFKSQLCSDPSNLEAVAAAIKDAAPHFRFSTNETKPKLKPDGSVLYEARVWETWSGAVDYVQEGDPVSAGVTEVTPTPSTNGASTKPPANRIAPTGGKQATQQAAQTTHQKVMQQAIDVSKATLPTQDTHNNPVEMDEGQPDADGAVSEAEEESSDVDYSAETDLDVLLEAANAKVGNAQTRLIEIAVEVGASEEDAHGATSWEDLVALINSPAGNEVGAEAAEEDSADDGVPKKGNLYKYIPSMLNKASGKYVKSKNPVVIEVLTVNTAKQNVTAQSNTTKKPILGPDKTTPLPIKWADLLPEE